MRAPVVGKRLVEPEDLLDHDVELGTGSPPCGSVAERLAKLPLDVVPGDDLAVRALLVQAPGDRQDEGFLEPLEVDLGVEQAVGVVDPQAGHAGPGRELEDQGMRGAEDVFPIDAEGRQGVDIEESAVVDLIRGHAPVGQPVRLRGEEGIEPVEAAGIARRSVQIGERSSRRPRRSAG